MSSGALRLLLILDLVALALAVAGWLRWKRRPSSGCPVHFPVDPMLDGDLECACGRKL